MVERSGTGLTLRRILPAPPEAVFAAWTDPGFLARWMSPHGVASATLDLRVGGAFRIVMKGPDRAIEHNGVYLEIDRPHRLVFTWRSEYTGSTPSRVTVNFIRRGDRTDLTLTHERLPADQVEPHGGGWGLILDRLDAVLRAGTSPRNVSPAG